MLLSVFRVSKVFDRQRESFAHLPPLGDLDLLLEKLLLEIKPLDATPHLVGRTFTLVLFSLNCSCNLVDLMYATLVDVIFGFV